MTTSPIVGILGIGNMGSGIAKNLIKHGFSVYGYDPDPQRFSDFVKMGGVGCANPAEVGKQSDILFVMVMRGSEADDAIFGNNGAVPSLKPGSTVVITATFNPSEVEKISAGLVEQGLRVIDSPVSGGYPGAQSGTLTLMLAASDELLAETRAVLEAISGTIHHVGTKPGEGQTVKACLQSLLGSIFSATFEATVLAAKCGVPGQVIKDVFSTSSGGSPLVAGALDKIIDRDFEGGGSHIATMYKDLTISMDVAREKGIPLFTASMAMQLFQAGMTRHPDGDNWVITKILEDIGGAELHR